MRIKKIKNKLLIASQMNECPKTRLHKNTIEMNEWRNEKGSFVGKKTDKKSNTSSMVIEAEDLSQLVVALN